MSDDPNQATRAAAGHELLNRIENIDPADPHAFEQIGHWLGRSMDEVAGTMRELRSDRHKSPFQNELWLLIRQRLRKLAEEYLEDGDD